MSGGSKPVTGYRYYMGLHFGVCYGPVDAFMGMIGDDKPAWGYGHDPVGTEAIVAGVKVVIPGAAEPEVTANAQVPVYAPELYGGDKKEGGLVGALDVCMGEMTQAPNDYLQSVISGMIPAFRGILSFVWRGGLIAANNPYIKKIAWRVRRIKKGWGDAGCWYPEKAQIGRVMNPAHIVYQCLTNEQWGMGYPRSSIDEAEFAATADALYEEGFGLSFLWNQQEQIEAFIQIVLDHCGGVFGVNLQTGKYALKLIRSDYVFDDLEEFDPAAIITLESPQRAGPGDIVNEITVKYRDLETGNDAGVTVQDLASIRVEGAVITKTKNYPGIRTPELAQRVALRDLRAISTPFWKGRVHATRAMWKYRPGDVFRLTWPKLGINNLVMRVAHVDRGTLTDGNVIIDCAEDVFGQPQTTYLAQQPIGWTDPRHAPAPAPYRLLVEAPYYDLSRTLSTTELAAVPPDAGFVEAIAVRPFSDAIDFTLETKTGSAAYADAAHGAAFAPTCTVPTATSQTATALVVAGRFDMDGLTYPTYAYFDSELIRVDSFTAGTSTLTVGRGIMDTVAASHAAGTRIIFADDRQAVERTERISGETVFGKILVRTGLGILAEPDAPADQVTLARRQYRPYPPGKFRINGAAYPAGPFIGDLTITWAHRSRLVQNLESEEVGNIGPEPGTTYNLRAYDNGTNTLLQSITGITGTTGTIIGSGASSLRIELESQRDGFTSLQKHVHVLGVTPFAGSWNPSDAFNGSAFAFSNGNATAKKTTSGAGATVRAGQSASAGKRQFQIVVDAIGSAINGTFLGFGNATLHLQALMTDANVAGAKDIVWNSDTGAGQVYQDGGTFVGFYKSPSFGYTTGDVLTFAIDFDAGKAWILKNGVSIQGDPVAGTSPLYIFTASTPMFAFFNASASANNQQVSLRLAAWSQGTLLSGYAGFV